MSFENLSAEVKGTLQCVHQRKSPCPEDPTVQKPQKWNYNRRKTKWIVMAQVIIHPLCLHSPDPKSLDLGPRVRILYSSVKIIKSVQYTYIQLTSETASFPHAG